MSEQLDLHDENVALLEEIAVRSVATGELKNECFFDLYASIASENGDTPDLDSCRVQQAYKVAGQIRYMQVDGYSLEVSEAGQSASGDLHLIVCDFFQEESVKRANAADIDASTNRAVRFFRESLKEEFLAQLEEASPSFELASYIYEHKNLIARLRVTVFTNAELKTRKTNFTGEDVGNVPVLVNVIDLKRYAIISSSGSEDLEIDFAEDFGGPIKCLIASSGSDLYNSYLFAIPGETLASIYSTYSNRLLEQNVRTYLQARTNVNRGILRTVGEEPAMFFAYNNGITATASEVEVVTDESGDRAISKITDFQIVNGGQTTASLLYARDGLKRNLENVYVQVKLSEVGKDELADVVPRISEYANTQNKVSAADLASNSGVQVKIEAVSKTISVPVAAGELIASKWFYERARGQYKNLFSYKSATERKKLEKQFPRSKMLVKTDLAKFEMTFDKKPFVVSEGAQKCFVKYSSILSKTSIDSINEVWFRRAMARAILFRELDSAINRVEWYREDRGYKSQTVTYALAAAVSMYESKGLSIDLDSIWASQEVKKDFLSWLLGLSLEIKNYLNDPPEGVRNIGEFAKREWCWTTYIQPKLEHLPDALDEFGISSELFKDDARQADVSEKASIAVDDELALYEIVTKNLAAIEDAKKLASPKNQSALAKLKRGNTNLTKAERNALLYLLRTLALIE